MDDIQKAPIMSSAGFDGRSPYYLERAGCMTPCAGMSVLASSSISLYFAGLADIHTYLLASLLELLELLGSTLFPWAKVRLPYLRRLASADVDAHEFGTFTPQRRASVSIGRVWFSSQPPPHNRIPADPQATSAHLGS